MEKHRADDPEISFRMNTDITPDCKHGNLEQSSSYGLLTQEADFIGEPDTPSSHVIPGRAPYLVSNLFLEQAGPIVDHKSGLALFSALSSQVIKLPRASSGHLLLPSDAFKEMAKYCADDAEAAKFNAWVRTETEE